MSKLLLALLLPIFFGGCFCKTKENSKAISDDDESCSKGMTAWMDSPFGFAHRAIDSWMSFGHNKQVETTFLFFSRQNDRQPLYVTNANVSSWDTNRSHFNPTIKNFFIIHGYKDQNAQWTRELKDALIVQEDCNVFIVENGQPSDTYSEALEHIEKVGKQVADFIRYLMKSRGLDPRRVHIIGHSAGAHSAGFAGKEIKKTESKVVDRITGLDPAGPGFYAATPDRRLDASDASFVDIIHTDIGCNRLEGFGLPDAIGHMDFYPNGGRSQPGCLTMSQFLDRMNPTLAKSVLNYAFGTFGESDRQLLETLLCSHTRAFDFFIESVSNRSCEFRSVRCSGWRRHLSGECDGNEEAVMGYHADEHHRELAGKEARRKFYLRTAAAPPFCIK